MSDLKVNELRRLNRNEVMVLMGALKLLQIQGQEFSKVAAAAMLEDDAEFVKNLFWAK